MRALRCFRAHIVLALAAAVLLAWWVASRDVSDPAASMPAQVLQPGDSWRSAASTTPTSIIPPLPALPAATGTIRGRVVDAETRMPIRDFRIELQRLHAVEGGDSPQPRSFRSAQGQFEWSGIGVHRWRLLISAADYQQFELDDVSIKANATTSDLLIPLRRGATLAGRVYDQSTGNPVAGAEITFREAHVARFASDWRHRRAVQTDARGLFEIEGVPRERLTLTVRTSEYAEREVDVVPNDAAGVEIALSSGATIAGLLAVGDGMTAVGGRVGLVHLENEVGTTIATEPNGEFIFRKLSPGRYRLIGNSERGRAEREVQIAGDERLEGIVLTIRTGGTIRGLIRGIRPQDLSRLSITVRRPNSGMTQASNARIDQHGSYVLNGVEAGRMIVTADVAMRRQLSKTVDMPSNGDMTVDFDFPPGLRLSGRVTRGDAPLATAPIEPQSAREGEPQVFVYPSTTNANGEYAIDDLAPGDYILRVGTHRSRVVRIQADTVFDIDIPLAAHFAGRVVEGDSDLPISGATVDIWGAETVPSRLRLHASSNHMGEFALSGLEPGEFVVSVNKPGYDLYREWLNYGTPIADRTIRLQPSQGVSVRILDQRNAAALRGVIASEMSNGVVGVRLTLHPDENGYSRMPIELAGSDIAFSAAGFFTTVIPSWDGRPVEVSLRPLKESAEN